MAGLFSRRAWFVVTTAVGMAMMTATNAIAGSPRNEFRYNLHTGFERYERLDGENWRSTDDASIGFHPWRQCHENDWYVEMESKSVPGLKNRIYSRKIMRQDPGTDRWYDKFEGKWVK